MKKIFYFALLLFGFIACEKENEEQLSPIYYTYTGYIGTNDNSTIISYDSNLIICGNSGDNISIIKITKSGDEIWRKDFNAGNMSEALSIVQTDNEYLFACGSTYRNYSKTGKDILLIKMNFTGDTIWTKTYGSVDEDYGKNLIETSDGNLIIAGGTYGSDLFGDIYLLKIDQNGDTIWTKRFSDNDQEVPFNLLETTNGEYLITGTNEDNKNPRGLYLLKVNTNGEILWNNTIGAGLWKWGYSTIELSSDELLTCGMYTLDGHSQILILKTDNQGNIIWEKEYGEEELSEQGNSIKQNFDGTFTITGSSYDSRTVQSDIVLMKIDRNGNQIWFKKFGGPQSEIGINLIKDINDNNIITGDYDGNIFMTTIDNNGNFK